MDFASNIQVLKVTDKFCSQLLTNVPNFLCCQAVEYPTGTKNRNFVEDHPRKIPAKFGSNWPSGFGEEA
jgi:hypothetical protein